MSNLKAVSPGDELPHTARDWNEHCIDSRVSRPTIPFAMNRTNALLTTTSLLFAGAAAALAAPGHKPNIILIVSDDLGYGELGSYGQRLIATPNLDRLAAEGVRFTRFYAGSPVCAPSRSVLLTGRHAGHTTVRGNSRVQNYAGQTLGAEDRTIAALLQQGGYRTALIGKWGLGLADSSGAPWKQGFDEFFGFLNQTHAHNHFPDHLWRNQEKVLLENDLVAVGDVPGVGYATRPRQYANDLFFAEAGEFVERNRRAPFFLLLALTIPHANDERAAALGDGQEVPDYGQYADKPWSNPQKGQAAMITRMDAGVGALLERLAALGIDRNTVVLFTSDNGPHRAGGAGYHPDFFFSSGGLRGIKRDLTEGGIRVPCIVRWPAAAPGGLVTAHVGHFCDLLATCADLAGIVAPRGQDGVSFASVLRDEPTGVRKRANLYWEFYEGGFQQAVLLDERWKAIRGRPGEEPFELYDLMNDPGERRNVARDHPGLVGRCVGLMDESHVPNAFWRKPADAHEREPARPK
ncbi:MAG: arylsulfatase [Lacunisphaera sp.]|nr:arylsulfatase [Lacunisphaera sp.]